MPAKRSAASLIAHHDMIPPGATVLCAVSGGADSVCLLHLLRALAPTVPFTLAAAHYNHRLRGAESDGDEAFVRSLCQDWDIPCHVGSGDVAGEAKARKQGIEETARQMRYAFLRQTAQELGGALIATAHNADDNAETVLLNLIRGTGLRGLTGISPVREGIIRPLLNVPRSEIMAYLAENGIPHREDSSNSDEGYTRNRLRAQVMPLLRELNPQATEHINAAAAQLSGVDRYLDQAVRPYLAQAQIGADRAALPMAVLTQVPEALRPHLLLRLIEALPVGRKDLGAVHLEALLSLKEGGHLDLPHGLTASRAYDTLVLSAAGDPPSLWAPFPPQEGENPVPDTGWTVVLSAPPWPGLVVRSRQIGDEITLPGRPRKSLKKLLIDRKIPRRERDPLPVVADNAGVLFVAGLGPNTDHPRRGAVQIIQQKEEREK